MLVGLIYNKKFKVYKPFLSKHLLREHSPKYYLLFGSTRYL